MLLLRANAIDIQKNENSITGKFLSGKNEIPVPADRRSGNGNELVVIGAKLHNLKNLTVKIPLEN